MSDQTLWELAQEIGRQHDAGFVTDANGQSRPAEAGIAFAIAQRMVEQWARERAAQWTQNAQDYGQRNRRENEIAWAITEDHVDDLGVPKEDE